jgi:mono/diheme cytochrome c family protein
MEFLSQHIIPPTAHYLDLLQSIMVLTYMIHLPYIGMVIGGVGSAMWFTLADSDHPNPRYARFAGDLLEVFLGNRIAILVLGILPIFVLTLCYLEWFVGAGQTPLSYIPWTLIPVVLGFGALMLYRRSFETRRRNIHAHLGWGSLGVVLLLTAYFILMAILCRLQDPEKWFRATNLGIMLLNWNAIWRFLFFMHFSFALTGAAILFFFFRWKGTRIEADGDSATYPGLVRNFGAGLAFAFSFALPVFYTFYIFTTADIALDNFVYLTAVGVVFLVFVNEMLLFPNLKAKTTRFATATFVVFLGAYLLVSINDQTTMVNANAEHRGLAVIEAQRVHEEREAMLQSLAAKAGGPSRGEEIFKGQCMACHRFDSRLVGPPLEQVLPKYKDDLSTLKKFVKNPHKVNPDYPPMPALGLSESDVDAVVGYVMGQLQERSANTNSQE